MHFRWVSKLCVLAVALALCATGLLAQHVVHAVTGAVTKVDAGAKTIAVKTADGSEEVFKYTAKTSVHGANAAGDAGKTAAVDAYMADKEGTQVVVRSSAKARAR